MAKVTTTLFGQLALIPIPSQLPFKEQLAWKTDLMTSYDGTEQRLTVRTSPRRRFNVNLPASAAETPRAFNTVYGARAGRWAVPMWMEAQQLGSVTPGLSNLTATTDVYDFRDDSLALLWETPRNWQVVEIQTVNSGSLDLYGTTNSFTNAWLLPVRIGHITGNVSRATNSYNAEYQMAFDLEDNLALSVSAPAQYLGDDIYFDEGLLLGTSINDTIIQRVEVVDEDLGVVAYRSPWDNPRVGRPFRWILDGPAEVFAFRQFLHRRAGRFRQFWQPTFDNDMRLESTGTVTDSLVIASDDFVSQASARTHIAIQTSDGTWYARAIDDAFILNGTQTQINLDSAINVAASSILRVSYLGLKRLDTDQIELDWIGGGVCQVEARIQEISP